MLEIEDLRRKTYDRQPHIEIQGNRAGSGKWQKKSPLQSEGFYGIGRRPTLPPVKAVPSARSGLTSLFGMGRGGPRRYNHLNVFLTVISSTAYGFDIGEKK